MHGSPQGRGSRQTAADFPAFERTIWGGCSGKASLGRPSGIPGGGRTAFAVAAELGNVASTGTVLRRRFHRRSSMMLASDGRSDKDPG